MAGAIREEPCRTALNRVVGMPFRWSLNPYMGCAHQCAFCYVRGFERRADRPAGSEYGRSIRVKVNVAEVLAAELRRPAWRREEVVVGAATDPYQPVEGRYRLTRRCLQALAARRTPFGVITRGTLIARDVDVLVEASRRADVTVNFSIPSIDPEICRITEPGAPPPLQRLRVLARLVDAGIRAGVGMAPLLPGLSDDPGRIAEVVRAARDHGATFLWANVLYLKPGTREHFLDVLGSAWPELADRYARIYAGRAHIARAEADPVLEVVREARRRAGIADRRTVRLHPAAEAVQVGLPL